MESGPPHNFTRTLKFEHQKIKYFRPLSDVWVLVLLCIPASHSHSSHHHPSFPPHSRAPNTIIFSHSAPRLFHDLPRRSSRRKTKGGGHQKCSGQLCPLLLLLRPRMGLPCPRSKRSSSPNLSRTRARPLSGQLVSPPENTSNIWSGRPTPGRTSSPSPKCPPFNGPESRRAVPSSACWSIIPVLPTIQFLAYTMLNHGERPHGEWP